jgi:hypothetical protein
MRAFNQNDHRQKRRDVFMSSIEWIANILAFVTAFLLTPEIYFRTVGWIVRVAESRYGASGDFLDLASFVWFVTVALLTFFMARATLATAIVAAGLAAATRFI